MRFQTRFVLFRTLAVSCFLFASIGTTQSHAQETLFQSDFSSDTGLVVLKGTDDTEFEFNYDYSDFDGIPEAPNTGLTGGAAQRGLKLEANLSEGVATAIAVATDGLELTGKYAVQADIWLNYNFPAGTAGTTEFGGLSVGHDGSAGGLDGASLLYTSDGDSGSDFRLFKSTTFQAIESEQYSVPTLNNSDALDAESGDILIDSPFNDAFPAIDLETAVPGQFIAGTTRAGAGGFRWMTLSAVVDTDAVRAGTTVDTGMATFTLTDADTGNSVEIGTVDNSNGGDVVSMSGDVAVIFTDIFSSVSGDSSLSFGLFDNLIVSTVATVADPLDCDADGSVTTADIGCATADTITATLAATNILAGDFDLDGNVGFPDFLVLSGNFGDATKGGVYAQGDVNLDGSVGFPDFLALSGNFGASSVAASSVPEPSGIMLFGLGIAFVIRRRRNS